MDRLKVKIINRSGHGLPAYETTESAGMDVRACLEAPVTLQPLDRALVPTGLRVQLPAGHEMQMRPRRGPAPRHGRPPARGPGACSAR